MRINSLGLFPDAISVVPGESCREVVALRVVMVRVPRVAFLVWGFDDILVFSVVVTFRLVGVSVGEALDGGVVGLPCRGVDGESTGVETGIGDFGLVVINFKKGKSREVRRNVAGSVCIGS